MLILSILGTSVAVQGAFFGSGSGSIILDNVLCRGSESSLLECNTNPIGQHNCDHSEDAGVRCNGNVYLHPVIVVDFFIHISSFYSQEISKHLLC